MSARAAPGIPRWDSDSVCLTFTVEHVVVHPPCAFVIEIGKYLLFCCLQLVFGESCPFHMSAYRLESMKKEVRSVGGTRTVVRRPSLTL